MCCKCQCLKFPFRSVYGFRFTFLIFEWFLWLFCVIIRDFFYWQIPLTRRTVLATSVWVYFISTHWSESLLCRSQNDVLIVFSNISLRERFLYFAPIYLRMGSIYTENGKNFIHKPLICRFCSSVTHWPRRKREHCRSVSYWDPWENLPHLKHTRSNYPTRLRHVRLLIDLLMHFKGLRCFNEGSSLLGYVA